MCTVKVKCPMMELWTCDKTTSGGRLTIKIVHLEVYNDLTLSVKELMESMKRALCAAEKAQLGSLSIPAIDTGSLESYKSYVLYVDLHDSIRGWHAAHMPTGEPCRWARAVLWRDRVSNAHCNRRVCEEEELDEPEARLHSHLQLSTSICSLLQDSSKDIRQSHEQTCLRLACQGTRTLSYLL